MSQLPIIGITTFDQSDRGYYHLASGSVKAVRLAGGLPVLLPSDEPNPVGIVEFADGLIFSGGGDLSPETYNGSTHPAIGMVDPKRDAFELELARLALDRDIPVLGICRGLGVLSVVSGGRLVTHIPEEFGEVVAHAGKLGRTVEHPVQIKPQSQLARIIGTTVTSVVSGHHQAVDSAPSGWRVAAHAPDGVIEALEHEHHSWAIALQWHPELAVDDLQQRIFNALVEAASVQRVLCQNSKVPITGRDRPLNLTKLAKTS